MERAGGRDAGWRARCRAGLPVRHGAGRPARSDPAGTHGRVGVPPRGSWRAHEALIGGELDGAATTRATSAGHALVERLTGELHKRIVGQEAMIERLLIGLLTGGHVLVEGVP